MKFLIVALALMAMFSTASAQPFIRLSGGKTQNEGHIEIYREGKWGQICHSEFGMAEAKVACYELGLGYPVNIKATEHMPVQELHWFENIICRGDEESLSSCPLFPGPNDRIWPQCSADGRRFISLTCATTSWHASDWGECSVTCGTGIQTRRVTCGMPECDTATKPEVEQSCTGDCACVEGEQNDGKWGLCLGSGDCSDINNICTEGYCDYQTKKCEKCVPTDKESAFHTGSNPMYNCVYFATQYDTCNDPQDLNYEVINSNCPATCANARGEVCPACSDTNNGILDFLGDGCDKYVGHSHLCGQFDTNQFIANTMCCSCGGGRLGVLENTYFLYVGRGRCTDENGVIAGKSTGIYEGHTVTNRLICYQECMDWNMGWSEESEWSLQQGRCTGFYTNSRSICGLVTGTTITGSYEELGTEEVSHCYKMITGEFNIEDIKDQNEHKANNYGDMYPVFEAPGFCSHYNWAKTEDTDAVGVSRCIDVCLKHPYGDCTGFAVRTEEGYSTGCKLYFAESYSETPEDLRSDDWDGWACYSVVGIDMIEGYNGKSQYIYDRSSNTYTFLSANLNNKAYSSNPCTCKSTWSAPTSFDSKCHADQSRCPQEACDDDEFPWCQVSNPGCDTDEGYGWSYCIPNADVDTTTYIEPKFTPEGCCFYQYFTLSMSEKSYRIRCEYEQDNSGIDNLNHEGWVCAGLVYPLYLKYNTQVQGGKWFLFDDDDFNSNIATYYGKVDDTGNGCPPVVDWIGPVTASDMCRGETDSKQDYQLECISGCGNPAYKKCAGDGMVGCSGENCNPERCIQLCGAHTQCTHFYFNALPKCILYRECTDFTPAPRGRIYKLI